MLPPPCGLCESEGETESTNIGAVAEQEPCPGGRPPQEMASDDIEIQRQLVR